MTSVFDNGGVVGASLDFGAEDKYILGSAIVSPTYIGTTTSPISGYRVEDTVPLSLPAGTQIGDTLYLWGAGDRLRIEVLQEAAVFGAGTWTFVSSFEGGGEAGLWSCTVDTLEDVTANALGGAMQAGVFTLVTVRGGSYTPEDIGGASSGVPTTNAVNYVDDSMILTFGFLGDEDVPISVPSGYTQISQAYGSGGGSSLSSTAAGYRITSGSGTEPSLSYSTTGDDEWVAISIGIAPSASTIYGNKKNSGIWNMYSVYNYINSIVPILPFSEAMEYKASFTTTNIASSTFDSDSLGMNDFTALNTSTGTRQYIVGVTTIDPLPSLNSLNELEIQTSLNNHTNSSPLIAISPTTSSYATTGFFFMSISGEVERIIAHFGNDMNAIALHFYEVSLGSVADSSPEFTYEYRPGYVPHTVTIPARTVALMVTQTWNNSGTMLVGTDSDNEQDINTADWTTASHIVTGEDSVKIGASNNLEGISVVGWTYA